jgi:hypothetical protein
LTTHHLKTWPVFFSRLASGEKTFEVRKNDRDYQVGDTLVCEEWNPDQPNAGYTGNSLRFLVTYVMPGGNFGIAPAFCVLGIRRVEYRNREST